MFRPVMIASIALLTVTAAPASQAQSPATKTDAVLEGRVVDAACYLMHPDAASGKTHDECGMACVKRGVPIGIANEADKNLYLDLEGSARLLPFLHERVRVTGTTEKKNEPLRLELPVSETNTMAVQLDGGYFVVKIRDIAKLPPAR